MLGHQDEIASSYRRTCTDLKEKLKIGLDKIYDSYKDGCQGNIPSYLQNCMDKILDPLALFEKKLIQYVRIKQEFQTENKNLQMKLRELQLNLQAKNVSALKFKEDIVSHYIQIEFLRKHNVKIEEDLVNTRKKLNQFERSEEWLKKHVFSLKTDTKYKQKLSNRQYNKGENQMNNREKIQEVINFNSSTENKTDEGSENIDGLRNFHVKLIEVYHENIFLKQVLQKMKNITDREDKLKRLLKSNHDNSTTLKLKNVQKKLQFDFSMEYEKGRTEQISQLNSIIDSMRVAILQLQFEKRNMELSVFKIRESFLKMKDMQRKLKEMLRSNQSFSSSALEHSRNFENNGREIEELMKIISNLKFEKLEMEMEHHSELRNFTDKFGEMEFILRDIKNVCDDISEENELCNKISKKYEKKLLSEESHELKNSFQGVENTSISDKEIILEDSLNVEENHISPTVMTTRNLNSPDFCEKCTPKYKRIPHEIQRKVKIIEEQYKRIVLTCSRNMDILKEVDQKSLVSLIRELKVLASEKEKSMLKEKNRFEKYKRFLLNSVKDYRKSYKTKVKQYETLRNLYIPITLELNHMKIIFSKKEKRTLNSDEIDNISKVIQRMNNLVEGIQMHKEPSDPISVSQSSNIQNNCNENILTTSLKDEIDEHFENRTVVDIQSLGKPKKTSICTLSNSLMPEDTFDESDQRISSLREHIDISVSLIEQLKKEKSILQTALTERDHLLGKIFNSFKSKIEGVAEEIHEKYFLQRLCNDLRSVIKIYGHQNKILKEALENNNICTKTVYIQRTLRRNPANNSENYIRGLLKQHRESCQIQETFTDIHCRLESMKKDLSLLQNVVIKR